MAAEVRVTEEHAIDSGIVDHALPLPDSLRESLQRDAFREHLLRLMQTVRHAAVRFCACNFFVDLNACLRLARSLQAGQHRLSPC
jgi:hypothetical protein